MKKRLIVILFIACLFLLTGCNKNNYIGTEYELDAEKSYNEAVEIYKKTNILGDKVLIGFLSLNEYKAPSDSKLLSGKHFAFYQANSTLPKGSYYPVYSDAGEGFSYPEVIKSGLNYAGYFKENGTRIATQVSDPVLYVRYISFVDAGLVVAVCMLIVFSILVLLCGIVQLFKYISPKGEAKEETKPVVRKQHIKLEDIKDEDMMVAVLVASIDYHEETKQDVRIVSVREL